jgi:hypothetical protein
MKKNRILGRVLAREVSREELEASNGALAIAKEAGVSTWTTRNPPDGPYSDTSGGGGVAYA